MPVSKSIKKRTSKSLKPMLKTPTGIQGLDEITGGGFPAGRPTLICGAPGAGKTLMSIEFIVKGAIEFGEPGVIMAFEEHTEDLDANVASLGFDLKKLQKDNLIVIDHVHIDRTEIAETGEYDLEGLFIRLGYAIDKVGAKRVMLDTVENLFSGLTNEGILRAELRRLFNWLKERGVTAVITGEKGESSFTRQGGGNQGGGSRSGSDSGSGGGGSQGGGSGSSGGGQGGSSQGGGRNSGGSGSEGGGGSETAGGTGRSGNSSGRGDSGGNR